MSSASHRVLAINAGSSTLRFALFDVGTPPRAILRGKIERIGTPNTRWAVTDLETPSHDDHPIEAATPESAANYLLDWLNQNAMFGTVDVVSHRVVHGLQRSAPERVTPQLLDELRGLIALDPEHLPFEIALMTAVWERHPALPQLACFDTTFHRDMPAVAKRLPIPRRYHAMGIERYGFHGLSYAFLLAELVRLGDPAATSGRVILAHLGSGASLAAVRNGIGIDTSMGFTPASGIMMSTRSGDLDPGLGHYLEKRHNLDSTQFVDMVSHGSGLLGVSESSSDMRDLLSHEDSDERAAEAIAMFCYQVRKCIGAYAAALGGLDTLVFAGGIGENAPPIRERICRELGFLGIELDGTANARSAPLLSSAASRAAVRVIRTDEELMLAQLALATHTRKESLPP
ncbi:MAG: acetate/propionate family kinase [Steroidobacteraceae bacterium]|nr:acetate/propionate family kinase [Steroidobacteraceae bacterium]